MILEDMDFFLKTAYTMKRIIGMINDRGGGGGGLYLPSEGIIKVTN